MAQVGAESNRGSEGERSRKGEWGFDASGLLTLASGLEIYFVYTESNVC